MATLSPIDVSVSSVRNALGVSTTNIGTLCTSPNINMWSRRKPVRDPRIDIPYIEVGKGADGMCGLILPPWEGDDTLLTYYAKPRGADGQYSEPYRLGDFRGYSDNRTLPITLLPQPTSISIKGLVMTLYLNDVYTFPVPGSIVVTLQDLEMQLCSFYYKHSSQSFLGWSPTMHFNSSGLTIEDLGALDVKFGLIPTAQVQSLNNWNVVLPGSGINIYELPRENTTQNKNWVNVPVVLSEDIIDSWYMSAVHSSNELHYSISATYSFTATAVIKEWGSDRIILAFNIPITANVTASGIWSSGSSQFPIELDKTYIVYIYDDLILMDSKTLSIDW